MTKHPRPSSSSLKKPKRKKSVAKKKPSGKKQASTGHAGKLRAVELLAQRALIEAGHIAGPERPDWTLDDAFPAPEGEPLQNSSPLRKFLILERINPNVSRTQGRMLVGPDLVPDDPATAVVELDGKAAVVLGAALLVRAAYEQVHGTARVARDLARRYAALNHELQIFLGQHGPDLMLQLRNFALVDGVVKASNEEAQTKFQEQCRWLGRMDSNVGNLEGWAQTFAQSLDDAVLAESAIHENRRHGPMMQFIAFLWYLGLPVREVAYVLGVLRKPETFKDRNEWESAAVKADKKVGDRVTLAKSFVSPPQPGRAGKARPGFQQRALVLICRYVDPRQPVRLHFGGVDVSRSA